jgi:putative polyketide hydroxylase
VWTPQSAFEPVLDAHLRELPLASLHRGLEVVGVQQRSDGATVTLRNSETAETEQVHAEYVIAADGIRSAVRSHLGIPFRGPDNLADRDVVLFRGALDWVVGERRYGLQLVTEPEAAGVLIPMGNDVWGYGTELAPGETRLMDRSAGAVVARLAVAAGLDELDAQIDYVGTVTFGAQVADTYRSGRGFLVGDAAHRLTPRGGTGMNTAIHDAHNLAWKLAWVLKGWADESLLDTYERERKPVGIENVLLSADPSGSERDVDEALVRDLGGRVAHGWLSRDGQQVSTLDLAGDGLTVLVGPDALEWASVASPAFGQVEVDIREVGRETAAELGLSAEGALVMRPDHHEVARWTQAPLYPAAAMAEVAAGLIGPSAAASLITR